MVEEYEVEPDETAEMQLQDYARVEALDPAAETADPKVESDGRAVRTAMMRANEFRAAHRNSPK